MANSSITANTIVGTNTAGGNNTEVQYNNGGSIAGISSLTFNGTNLTGTAVYDFGGATSFEIPNGAAPTVDAAGEIAIDTTIADYTGMIKYHDGVEELTVLAVPTANLSTTDGHVVAYNAANNELEMVAPTGGDWELISSATASASSSIDFTGLSSTYFMYRIVFHDVVAATDAVNMYFRISDDNGSTWKSGASDYSYVAVVSGTGAMAPSVVNADSKIDTMHSGIDMGNAAGEFWAGEITIINPGDSGSNTQLQWYMGGENSTDNYVQSQGNGVYRADAATDGFRIILSSGNIAQGNFRLYGIKAS